MIFRAGKTVYHYFRQWRIDGDWQRIHEQLRQWVRAIEDRHPSPTAAILDSQSVETATMIHPEVGYDGGKKTKGRKRHLLVDTLGLMMVVVVQGGIAQSVADATWKLRFLRCIST